MWWWSKWVGVILSRRSVLGKKRFWGWAAKLKRQAAEVHAVYEACGFGFTLQRQLAALGIHCYVVCPQKLDERNKRVKTDGLDAKALCLKLDRFVEGNRDALALVRVPAEKEEQLRAIHRQREQLVKARKQLEAQGRSLMVNHGIEPVQQWWKRRAFAQLQVPEWMRTLCSTANRSSNGEPSWLKVPWLVALRAKKPSSPWPGNWRLICGDFAPAAAHPSNWA